MTDHPASTAFRGPVAYLTGSYPKASHTFIAREIAALRSLGVEVVACSVRRTPAAELSGPAQQAEAAATFCILDAARAPHRLIAAQLMAIARAPRRWASALRLALAIRPAGLKALVWQLFYLAEAAVLAAHLRRKGVVHLHNHFGDSSCTVALLTSQMTGIPFSYTEHGPSIFFAPHHWRLDVKAARARFVACISHFCRSQVMLFADPVHWDRLHIVRCGIDADRYDRPPGDAAAGAAGRVVFIGRLAAVKGVRVLLEAVAALHPRHPGLSLTLIGDGPDRAALAARAAALGLADRVRFTGYLSEEEVAAALAQSDLLVLPSFAEGVPVVLMEAMASGLPVVATRVGGVAELVEDGVSGCLVAPGDPEGLATAIDRLLSDPALARRFGAAGRIRVRDRHDSLVEATRLRDLFAAPPP
ncbi:MAG: glycosyltransferase family 4 protein [Alkalilacustris sp.]